MQSPEAVAETLSRLKDSVESGAIPPAAPPAPEAPKEPEMVSLLEGPKSFLLEKTGDFWIGLPLSKIDYLTASALLDRCKIDILILVQKAAAQAQKNKLLRPGADNFRGIFNRLKGR